MREINIVWFEQFLEDYQRHTHPEFRQSESAILEKFAEIGYDYDFFIISVDEEIAVDGHAKIYQFVLVDEDRVKAMKYSGWADV
ncbi:hypothetical protein [Enterococcus sp.]|uniref:hypothetical protein n=1 Tax=Enterococcus sp. TaxID=35783 RepID=UPI0029113694|nr:hypothetical protein [Enterococcus sp.]MDU5335742.1 hypothetical protein [Enterococcus sp.]